VPRSLFRRRCSVIAERATLPPFHPPNTRRMDHFLTALAPRAAARAVHPAPKHKCCRGSHWWCGLVRASPRKSLKIYQCLNVTIWWEQLRKDTCGTRLCSVMTRQLEGLLHSTACKRKPQAMHLSSPASLSHSLFQPTKHPEQLPRPIPHFHRLPKVGWCTPPLHPPALSLPTIRPVQAITIDRHNAYARTNAH
jgi:hypothetical protein